MGRLPSDQLDLEHFEEQASKKVGEKKTAADVRPSRGTASRKKGRSTADCLIASQFLLVIHIVCWNLFDYGREFGAVIKDDAQRQKVSTKDDGRSW